MTTDETRKIDAILEKLSDMQAYAATQKQVVAGLAADMREVKAALFVDPSGLKLAAENRTAIAAIKTRCETIQAAKPKIGPISLMALGVLQNVLSAAVIMLIAWLIFVNRVLTSMGAKP